ncbi:MAG: 16S rRNA (cytidine(1402)-2'-O)-methyltransferase [Gammaproteobacteria bacterium]|nr:16S rRNA (cytidine(1402)-2'-O)-methyltransferase [Gammaproteobacteria bacterium]
MRDLRVGCDGVHDGGIIVTAASGRLDVIGLPIGNLADLAPRARAALAAADLVAAEDTRRTGALLTACGISRPLVSLHDFNEARRVAELVERLCGGAAVALVSDAGTPLISDPGFALVRAAAAAGVAVRPIPGPSAVTAALSVAGLPTDRFAFEGFLPERAAERRRALGALAGEMRTLVFFEAPHRIAATLADLAQVLGGARCALLARELSKTHETLYRGTLDELVERTAREPNVARGEITLVVEGARAEPDGNLALLHRALELLLPEMPPARAAAVAGQLAGVKRARAYELALQLAAARSDPAERGG